MSKCVRVAVGRRLPQTLDGKLAGYLAATGAVGIGFAQQSQAAVVANTTVQPFGINGEVNIDFNSDGQIDFQIDHDRVNLNGKDIDYLQIDKNDVNGQSNPLDIDNFLSFPPAIWHQTFPVNGTHRNNDAGVMSFTNEFGDLGGYPVALRAGNPIGGSTTLPSSLIPGAIWDWQENSGFGGNTYIRANRLIDEDMGQIDSNAGRPVTVPFGPQPEYPDLEDFVGLNGEVRYLGVRTDLNDAGYPGNPISTANGPGDIDVPGNYWYGWIGIRITNEADATGEVVGYGYETQKGVPILAGDVGTPAGVPGDYNGNNVVDAADYTVWRDGGPLLNEGASPGVVDEEDYNFWKSHFGNVPGSGSLAGGAAVPEPSSCVMAAIGGGLLLSRFVLRKLFGRD